MKLKPEYAKLVRMGIGSSANLPDLNDMTDRGPNPLKPWTASKTVGTINLIKRHNIQDEETFVDLFQAESKIPLETLTEQVYAHQMNYFGHLKYDMETIFRYTYCCVVVNSLRGNSTERKFSQWSCGKLSLMDPPAILDEKFHTDKLELNSKGRITAFISVKPNSFSYNCLQYTDVFGGLQALNELTGKPWKIYYLENDGFSKLDLGFFNTQDQEMVRVLAKKYARSEIDLLNNVLSELPF
jgi:hypothetical protein